MNKKQNCNLIIILASILVVFAFSISVINTNTLNEVVQTNASTLSNKKIGWGLKRAKDHQTPDLGIENLKLLEQYNGVGIGDTNLNKVYLTFDEGYEAGYTEQILDTLKNNSVQATFFITAHYVNTKPDLVQKMIDEGHIVGNQFPTMVMYHI